MLARVLVLFFAVAATVLSCWALVGSYKNEAYLTNNYLISFQLTSLNLSAVLLSGSAKHHSKRDFASLANLVTSEIGNVFPHKLTDTVEPTGASEPTLTTSGLKKPLRTDSKLFQYASTALVPPSVATLAADLSGNVQQIINNVVGSLNYSELGLADMYSVSYWGYCRGNITGDVKWLDKLGRFGKQFNPSNLNVTYCTPAKVGYRFDPLKLFKSEVLNALRERMHGGNALAQNLQAELLALVSLLTWDEFGLPGNLKQRLTLLDNCTVAAWALILIGACLLFIIVIVEVVAIFCTPHVFCLLCLNFVLMVLTFLVVLLGSALSTGAYMYVRLQVNKEVKEFGVKVYLLVQYYAFSWSAFASSFMMLVIAILGYCCGWFGTGNRYRPIEQQREPEMGYEFKE